MTVKFRGCTRPFMALPSLAWLTSQPSVPRLFMSLCFNQTQLIIPRAFLPLLYTAVPDWDNCLVSFRILESRLLSWLPSFSILQPTAHNPQFHPPIAIMSRTFAYHFSSTTFSYLFRCTPYLANQHIGSSETTVTVLFLMALIMVLLFILSAQ